MFFFCLFVTSQSLFTLSILLELVVSPWRAICLFNEALLLHFLFASLSMQWSRVGDLDESWLPKWGTISALEKHWQHNLGLRQVPTQTICDYKHIPHRSINIDIIPIHGLELAHLGACTNIWNEAYTPLVLARSAPARGVCLNHIYIEREREKREGEKERDALGCPRWKYKLE